MALDSRSDSDSGESANPPRTTSKRILIIAGLVAVAVALVGGSLATSWRPEPGRTTPAPDAASELKQGDPNAVAPDGAELKLVTTPPSRTHGMITLPDGTPEIEARVTFRPYGTAPRNGLVIRIETADPVGSGADAATLAKRMAGSNLLVRPGEAVSPSSLKGGEYEGVIRTVAEQDAYAFLLVSVEPRP